MTETDTEIRPVRPGDELSLLTGLIPLHPRPSVAPETNNANLHL